MDDRPSSKRVRASAGASPPGVQAISPLSRGAAQNGRPDGPSKRMTAQKLGYKPPRHVAIIMDGNGRWAEQRGLPRVMGHREGVEAVRRTVTASVDFGIEHLTLYSFSTENWKRPPGEVRDLMQLLRLFVQTDLSRLKRQGVRVRVIGDRASLSPDLVALVTDCERKTAEGQALNLNIAFNYGGRDELRRAVRSLAAAAAEGRIDPSAIDEADIARALDTSFSPDPDLLVRTSGEQRISNFLLWQTAYSEFVFQDVLWPDFSAQHLRAAVEEFAHRDRRYGGRDAKAAG